MTVKEVFDLRKQGKIEEAYAAIRPMYAAHQGKYTTLCMFWTASDILKKRIGEKRTDEAIKIFEALLRVLPRIDDTDGKAHQAILHGALRLSDATDTGWAAATPAAVGQTGDAPDFSMLDFIGRYGVENLTAADWQGSMSTPKEGTHDQPHLLPSTAQRILTRCFHEIQEHPDADHALKVMPLLEEAMRRSPRNKNNMRYMAVVYRIMGEKEKAIDIYQQLLTRHRDSFLYAELAQLTDDPGKKAALYCRAIQNQRQEQFRQGYRLALAQLLLGRDNTKAAYELQKVITTRQQQGYHLTRELLSLQSQLQGVVASTEAEQQAFYKKMAEKFL